MVEALFWFYPLVWWIRTRLVHERERACDEAVLRMGTPEQVTQATQRCVAAGGGQRHLVNLNHGVDKATPVANFEAFVRAAKGG